MESTYKVFIVWAKAKEEIREIKKSVYNNTEDRKGSTAVNGVLIQSISSMQ